MKQVDVREATHVQVDGQIGRIKEKWGVGPEGGLAPPSRGGFGVVTVSGRRLTMWQVDSYWKDE